MLLQLFLTSIFVTFEFSKEKKYLCYFCKPCYVFWGGLAFGSLTVSFLSFMALLQEIFFYHFVGGQMIFNSSKFVNSPYPYSSVSLFF